MRAPGTARCAGAAPGTASQPRQGPGRRYRMRRPIFRPASTISAIATMTTTIAPPPPDPLLSLSDEEEEDDEEDEDDPEDSPVEFHARLVNIRKNSSPKKPTTPAMITAITIICTSPLRMWVSSWPSTASIS